MKTFIKLLSVAITVTLMATILLPCLSVSAAATTYSLADFQGKYKPLGRTLVKDGNLVFAQSASGIAFNVEGSGDLGITLKLINRRTGDADGVAGGYFTVIVDGVKLNADKRYPADRGSSWTTNSSNYPYVIVTKGEEKTFTIPGLSNGKHTIEIIGQNEPDIATLAFKSITFAGTIADAPANREIYVEAIGDSISTGFGLLANSGSMHGYASLYQDATLAWPYLLASSLNADLSVVGRAGIAANPGTGYTGDMISYYPKTCSQIDSSANYDFSRQADVVVVCLGTNDLGVPNGKTQDQLKEGIKNMLKLARQKNPNAHIVLMYNMMRTGYDSLFSAAASELGGAASRYYSLKLTTNNAAAGSHPNLSAHASYAADLKALIDTFTFEPMPENAPADYSEVDKAIAKAQALTKTDYADFSAVDNAIAAVVRNKTVKEQDVVNAMAKAINDAINSLVPVINESTDTFIYFKGSAKKYLDGEITAYGIPDTDATAGWGAENYMISKFKLEADATYLLNFDWKGHNYQSPITITAADKAAEGYKLSGKSVNVNNGSSKTAYKTMGFIFNSNDVIANGCDILTVILRDYGDIFVNLANVKLTKIDNSENSFYPARNVYNIYPMLDASNNLYYKTYAWFESGSLNFDYIIDPDKEYKLTLDFKGRNINGACDNPEKKLWSITAVDSFTKGHDMNATRLRIETMYGKDHANEWKTYTFTFKGSQIGANETNKYFAIQQGYLYSEAFLRNIKIEEISPANYTAVDNAIANANGLNKDNYVDFSGVTSAIDAVIRNKLSSEQAAVDAMADAINNAISALVLKDADYTKVDEAFAKVVALPRLYYKDLTAVDAAAEAIVRGKKITEQAEVDAMAKAIEDALAALEYKDADYTEVEKATAKAVALRDDADLYNNFQAVEDAIAEVELGKNITEQALVDAMAKAINDAVAALELKDADYSKVDEAIEAAEAIDGNKYTNYDAVLSAIDAVVTDKKITEQAEVDAMAKAINDAVAALIEKADYSAFIEIVEKYADEIGEEEEYTEESVAALKAVMDKIIANENLPADRQAEVDALAEEFEAAIKALVKKPTQNQGGETPKDEDKTEDDKTEEKVEDNKTDKVPDKTGDSSNVVLTIVALAASVIGLAILVISKKVKA